MQIKQLIKSTKGAGSELQISSEDLDFANKADDDYLVNMKAMTLKLASIQDLLLIC